MVPPFRHVLGPESNGELMKDFLKTLIFTVLIPGTVTVYIPYRLLSRRAEYSFSGYQLLGVLPIAVEVGFYFWYAWDFAFAGHGTPAPIDPPKALVSSGLHQVARNPMYVAVLLILFGESLHFASGTVVRHVVLVWLFFHLFLVFYEEPVLKKKFGIAYQGYCKTVWRWLPPLPRVW